MNVGVVSFLIDGTKGIDKNVNDWLKNKDVITIWFDQSYHQLWVVYLKEGKEDAI